MMRRMRKEKETIDTHLNKSPEPDTDHLAISDYVPLINRTQVKLNSDGESVASTPTLVVNKLFISR